jgi:hypothetical protein
MGTMGLFSNPSHHLGLLVSYYLLIVGLFLPYRFTSLRTCSLYFFSTLYFFHSLFISCFLSCLLSFLNCSSLFLSFPCFLPNVVVEWLTLLLRIREVLGSNLSPGDRLSWLRFFVVFLSPSTRMPG